MGGGFALGDNLQTVVIFPSSCPSLLGRRNLNVPGSRLLRCLVKYCCSEKSKPHKQNLPLPAGEGIRVRGAA